MTDEAAALYQRGLLALQERRKAEAAELLAAALASPDGALARKERRRCHMEVVKHRTLSGDWAMVEEAARQGLGEFPENPDFHQSLGEALLQLGRVDEAVAALTRSLEINPEQDGARSLLAIRHIVGAAPRHASPVRPWPMAARAFRDPRGLMQSYLLRNRPKDPFIKPGTVFAAFGSCFAEYVARQLRAAGHPAFHELIGEEVNSTYANRHLLEWVEKGPVDGPTQAMHGAYGEAGRERLRRGLTDCQVVIMTLGVAASLFDDDGNFVFIHQNTRSANQVLDRLRMRTTTVAENVENIGLIIEAVRRLAGPQTRIVLTVSPVPLKGTTEFDSAIVADCLSKSTLRLACQEVVATRAADGVLYWPSFEMVRWVGANFGPGVPPVYGAEDGNSRHVSKWLADLIVGLFLEFHSEAAAAG
jgi:tetratricopeptide (TPR) repeat protein